MSLAHVFKLVKYTSTLYVCNNFISRFVQSSLDVQLVRSTFGDILQCLPVDYEKTLQVVQDYLTDEHICIILSNSDHSSANKAILDCLIEKANHTRNLFEFCDQIEKILPLSTNQGSLTNKITEIRTST